MQQNSEYTFPIFISSRDYTLKDLRGELVKFLTEQGYKPVLSTGPGFPDDSPHLEPWESCLPVLSTCFVMILIIDGDYGNALPWPNFTSLFSDKKYSPTHGEYMFAHKNNKRMLVFIRRELMPYYQVYRTTIKNSKNIEEAKLALLKTLPKTVTFETLNFIHDVKTTSPIPWITEFDDVTDIKRDVQKKMVNQLAEIFLSKQQSYDAIVNSFSKVMDSLSTEEQKNTLQKINAAKEIIDAVSMLDEYKIEIEEARNKLQEARNSNSENKKIFEEKIELLTKKISDLEQASLNFTKSEFFIANGQLHVGNPIYMESRHEQIITSYDKYRFVLDVSQSIENNGFPDNAVFKMDKHVKIHDILFNFVLQSSGRIYLVLIQAFDNHYQRTAIASKIQKMMRKTTRLDLPIELITASETIQPIIIAPSHIRFLGKQSSGIPILKYIVSDATFKNWDDIQDLFRLPS